MYVFTFASNQLHHWSQEYDNSDVKTTNASIEINIQAFGNKTIEIKQTNMIAK